MRDALIWHQIHLERYKNGRERELLSMYWDMRVDVRKEMERLEKAIESGKSTARWTLSRFRILDEQLTDILKKGYTDMNDYLAKANYELAAAEIVFVEGQMQGEVGASVTVELPTMAQVNAAVIERPFEGWVNDKGRVWYVPDSPLRRVEAHQLREMHRVVRRMYLTGQGVREAEKRLEIVNQATAALMEDFDVGRRSIKTEARTAMQQYATTAQEETYRENEDIFPWVEFTATLDYRTTVICGTLDGKVWRVSDPAKPGIPQHWNCRSIWVPKETRDEEVDSDRPQVTPGPEYERGDQTTATGKVRKPRKATEDKLTRGTAGPGARFDSWLRKQNRENPDFVRDYFKSDTRYRKWVQGELGRIKYTNTDGREYDVTALSKPVKYVRK